MGFWNELGLLRKDNRKCFQNACLITRDSTHAEKRIPFKYSTINEMSIADTESSMPMNYDKKTKAIFTYDYNLPFVTGARIELMDRTTMVVTSIEDVVDENKAERDGVGRIGLNLYLG